MKIGRVYATFQRDFWYTEHYIARELFNEGHQTVFITSDRYPKHWEKYLKNKDKEGSYTFSTFSVVRLKSFFPLEKSIFRPISKLTKLLFNSDFDVLHLYGVGNFSTLIVLWLCFFNRKPDIPLLISDHSDTRTHAREGIFAKWYHVFFKLQLKLLLSKINRIISFSNVGVKVLGSRYNIPSTKFSVISLGYDQETFLFNPKLKNKEKKFIIGYAGKIDSKKRVDYLIAKLSSSKIAKEIKLIVVGMIESDLYCQKLRSVAKDSSLDVEFRPFADRQGLADFYNYIDVAIFPGGISITTIEANGCGTPVIIYKSIDGLEERVQNGRGKLFGTSQELLLATEGYYQLYKENSIDNDYISEVTRNTSSWQIIKDRYLKLYQQAIYESKN